MSRACTRTRNKSDTLELVRKTSTGGHAPLRDCVRDAVNEFFAHLDGHSCRDLYRMVLAEMEAPLLEAVMRHTEGNQSNAAELLGINRATLRKKLRGYNLL